MSELPYKFTICPDGPEPEPKLWTATTPHLLSKLRDGPRDLTINQAEYIWPAGGKGVTTINNHKEKKMSDVFKLIEKHGIELHGEIEYFAELVRQEEREACAKVCDLVANEIDDTNGTATYCAKAIRARGEK